MQAHGNSALIVTTGPVQVQMHGQQATMKFKAHLTGGSGRLLPDSAQTYSITSGWRQEEGEWHVYFAQWDAVH